MFSRQDVLESFVRMRKIVHCLHVASILEPARNITIAYDYVWCKVHTTCFTDHFAGGVAAGTVRAWASETSCRRSMWVKPTNDETVLSVDIECSISIGVGDKVATTAQSVPLWLKLSMRTYWSLKSTAATSSKYHLGEGRSSKWHSLWPTCHCSETFFKCV